MKMKKLSVKALMSLILSAILFCMPVGAFFANRANTVEVHAEDTAEQKTESAAEEGSAESTASGTDNKDSSGSGENQTVAAMDCLVPGIGEIIGGSQREDDIEKLEKRMDELGLKKEDYDFYLDLRKYGSTRHSGFGLGFERCVMYLTGMGNIRDVIPFPRTVKNCDL